MATFDALWNYRDPVATRTKFNALRSDFVVGSEPYLELLTQIARTHSLSAEFTQAHAILDDVKAALTPATPVAHIRYLLERGRSYRSAKESATATPLFQSAFDLAQQHGEDSYAVDAAHMMALVVTGDEQQTWNLKAMAIAEASDEPPARKWLGSLYNNIGWTYHDQGDFESALTAFQKGVDWQRVHGSIERLLIAKWTIGRTLRSLHRVDAAFEVQEAVLAERAANNLPAGYVHEELGELWLMRGDAVAAQPHFALAYDALSADVWLQRNELDRLNRLKTLGQPDQP